MGDYSIRDADSIFDLISRTAQELFSAYDWSGLQSGSLEWMIAKVVAEASELIGRYQDERAKQGYISTATLRRDLRNIAENMGLYPTELSAASAELTIVASDDVVIPIGSKVGTDNGIEFVTTEALTLSSATSLTGTVTAINAKYSQINYVSSGEISERISLNTDSVIVGNLVVTVNGTAYTKQNSFASSSSTDKHYTVDFDDRNRVVLVFGSGVYGSRLPASGAVVIDVFYGGGVGGNSAAAASLTNLLSSFSNSTNITSITNSSAASGGSGAQSIESIRNSVPAQLRQIAGIINREDAAQVITSNLSWVADAVVDTAYTVANSLYVPTATVYAFPSASAIQDKSTAQNEELTTFINNRGALGVSWGIGDGYEAPVEIELSVKINNRALENQKTQQIKNALTADEGAPFAFSSLRFDREIYASDITDVVESVDGIVYAELDKFAAKPQVIYTADSDPFADIELGDEAEDGYYAFTQTGSQAASCDFFRPIKPTEVTATYVRDTSKNWVVEDFTYSTNSEFDAVDGPIVTVSGGKLQFKQLGKVWIADQFNGSNWDDKYILRVSYNDNDGVNYVGYYHINDTTAPDTIVTVEDAASPIGGTAIPDMASGTYTDIYVQIIEDQTEGSTGLLITPFGTNYSITYNDKNSLYITSPQAPIGVYSHIKFGDTAIDTSADSWVSETGALKARLYITTIDTDDHWKIYTTPLLAKKLYYKATHTVFTLDQSDIVIRFV